jgi:PAS domain S-box-containing protein
MNRPPPPEHTTWLDYAIAAAAIALATVARALLDPALGNHLPYVTFFIAVMFVGWRSGLRPALLALVLGWVASDFFFVPPRGVFGAVRAMSLQNLVGTATYFLVAGFIVVAAHAMRTARRRAAAREELLRVTLASIGDAVITTEPDGRVVFLNDVAQALTGWSRADAAGQPLATVFNVVNERTRELVENPARRALAEGVIVGLANHTVLIARDGAERPIDDSVAPIRDESGQIVGCVLIFRDITERRIAERELRASEARKAQVLQSSLEGIVTIDSESRILGFNPAAERLFGWSDAEALGADLAELVIPQRLRDAHRRGMAHLLATGEGPFLNRRLELPATRKDGSEILIELTISAPEGAGHPTFTAFIRDITASKQAERALRASEERFRSLVGATTSIVWTADEAGEFVTPQPSWTAYTGQSWEQLRGFGWIEAVHPDDRQRIRELWESARNAGSLFSADGRLWHAGSGAHRHFEARGIPVHEPEGSVREWVGMYVDVEDQRQAEKQAYGLMAELREADRHKDEFLATLSHELRGPLAPLRNTLEILKRAGADPDVLERARRTMERQLDQLVRLVDDLLDVGRISRGRIELRRQRVELASVIHHAVEAVRAAPECRDHDITVTLPTQQLYLDADPVRLVQAFGNLLNNGCKYSSPGARITLTAQRQGSDVVVTVKDEGIGIAADVLPKIFEMFAHGRSGGEHGGLGIGLALAKRLVEMHGGSIEARSEGAGRGSEFVVRFPLLVEEAAQPAAPPSAEPRSTGSRRFLVVDDNEDSASSLALLLQISGHEIHVAHDGLEALAAAEQFRPDVALLDIGLPKLNGHDVARRIRAQPWGRGMVLVALTGWGQDVERRKSKEAGFDHHVVKPVDYAALLRLLEPPGVHEHPAGRGR